MIFEKRNGPYKKNNMQFALVIVLENFPIFMGQQISLDNAKGCIDLFVLSESVGSMSHV